MNTDYKQRKILTHYNLQSKSTKIIFQLRIRPIYTEEIKNSLTLPTMDKNNLDDHGGIFYNRPKLNIRVGVIWCLEEENFKGRTTSQAFFDLRRPSALQKGAMWTAVFSTPDIFFFFWFNPKYYYHIYLNNWSDDSYYSFCVHQ